LLIAETELWPNLLRIAHQNDCPVVIANGRISDKSFPKYKKIAFFLKTILENISLFCAQTELDAKRIIELGLSRETVKICGNCKFDFPLPGDGKRELREKFKLANEDWIVVAGSTRPGEEEVILNAYQQIRDKFANNLRLILAPRHLNRLEEVIGLIEQFELSYQQRSHMDTEFTKDVYLLDTMGELSKIYGAADIAVVGGTLFPFGGHNPLEPAMYGVPVVFGKYISNARESYMALQESGGGMQIFRNELADVLTMLLSHPERLKTMGEQAKSVILSNRGASDAIVSDVETFF
jgi:3-deoxy-D-manno-octulosonic-acid transferase